MDTFQRLATPQKYFYLAEKISHTTELTRVALDMFQPETRSARSVDQSVQQVYSLVSSLAIAHGRFHLLNDDEYLPYLTSSYIQAATQEPFRLHLVQSLPDSF